MNDTLELIASDYNTQCAALPPDPLTDEYMAANQQAEMVLLARCKKLSFTWKDMVACAVAMRSEAAA